MKKYDLPAMGFPPSIDDVLDRAHRMLKLAKAWADARERLLANGDPDLVVALFEAEKSAYETFKEAAA